jgi:hypothetical protein
MPTISFNEVNEQHTKYDQNPKPPMQFALFPEKELMIFLEKIKMNLDVTHISVVMIESPEAIEGVPRTTVALFGANSKGEKINQLEGIYSIAPCPPKCKSGG